MLIIRIANYPDRLGPSGKHFHTKIVLHLFMALNFPHLSNTFKELRINVLFVRKQICSIKQPFVEIYFYFKLPV
jgi:hypothetical protein